MKARRIFAALLAVIILTISTAMLSVSADSGIVNATPEQLAQKMVSKTYNASNGYELNYHMYYSPSYSRAEPAMLILYFHGDAGKGTDGSALFNEKSLLHQLVSDDADRLYKDFQYIVVAPQCPEGESFVELTPAYNGKKHTLVMNAVNELMGETEATETLEDKFLLAGMGSGTAAAFDYMFYNPNKITRIMTIGGSCAPDISASTFASFDISSYIFAEEGNAAIKELDETVQTLAETRLSITYMGKTFDECLDYALSYNEPSLAEWLVKDAYTSKQFRVYTTCNNDGGTISSSPEYVPHDASSVITVTLKPGYIISGAKCNGEELDLSVFKQVENNDKQYTYTITNIKVDQSVSVELTRFADGGKYVKLIDTLIISLSVVSVVLIIAACIVAFVTYMPKRLNKKI